MPKLPDYTALGERPVPRNQAGVAGYSPSDPTAFSRGMGDAARELQQAAGIIAETNQRQDVMLAEAAFNQLQAQRLELEMGDTGFQKVKAGRAAGQQFVDDYTQKYADVSARVQESLQNDNQRRLFSQREPVARMQFRSALLKHQASETERFNEQTENDTIDLARRQIFSDSTNPQAVDAGLAQINWAIDQKAQRNGWDDQTTALTKQKFTDAVMTDVASMMVERDPVGSLAAINKRMGVGGEPAASGVTAIDAIGIPKLVELRHRAASYVAVADNRMKAEQEKRVREAESATKELQTFALSGQVVSPVYEREVLAKVAGTIYEAPARQMITESYSGVTHGSLPLPAQEQRLRALDAVLVTGGSSPDQSELRNKAYTITETQRRDYKENPWAAAAKYGRQQPVQELAIQDPSQVPQLIAQRLPLMTGVEMFAGQSVSPLQPNEAKDFAEKLKAMPPDQRAEVLGQTGVMLSAPRVAALADQLDKHDRPLALALGMGLDRTTAGRAASAYVLRGAQALSDKTVKKDDAALAGWRAEIAGLVRGTLGDDRAESQVIDAAYFVRAALDQEGIAPAGFDPMKASAENALAMVIGLPMQRGGLKTLLPRGMKERDFDERLKAFTPEKLATVALPRVGADGTPQPAFFLRGTPITAQQLSSHLREYGMKRDGAGRYVPVIRNAPVTLDPQGQQLLRLEVR